jgi:hypothetical protein
VSYLTSLREVYLVLLFISWFTSWKIVNDKIYSTNVMPKEIKNT